MPSSRRSQSPRISNSGGAFPYPFTRVVTLNSSTLAVLSQPDFWGNTVAWLYPAIAVNGRGHIAGEISALGGTGYATSVAFIRDDLSGDPAVAGWETYTLAASTNSTNAQWGDYSGAAAHERYPNTWIVAGHQQAGGSASSFSSVRFAWIMRERDDPAVAATKLAFSGEPTSGTVGVALSPLTVQIQNASSTVVAGDNTTQVTLTKGSGPGTLTCATITAISGVATFTDCTVSAAGSYVLHAVSNPVLTTADTAAFAVTAAPPTKLAFTQQPSPGAAGQTLATQPVVAVQDATSSTVTGDNSTQVTLALTGAGSGVAAAEAVIVAIAEAQTAPSRARAA